jgi:hypothetical protein
MNRVRPLPSIPVLLLLALLWLGSAACRLDAYETGSEGRWNHPDASLSDAETRDASVVADACEPTEEVCDGLDNDCDGVVDNGFDLQTDPNHCGDCGRVCQYDHALSSCVAGQCVRGACLPGHHDLNELDSDGCEYACHETNDGTELCDGVDNDCDGEIDEDFDFQTDPDHCGECANVCVFLNGNGACQGGQCVLGGCRGGYADLDGQAQNGCECRMDLAAGGPPCTEGVPGDCGAGEVCADVTGDGTSTCAALPQDLCDGRDNDCDAAVDEDATAILQAVECYTFPSGCVEVSPGDFQCTGECSPGSMECHDGELACTGETGPRAESCNDLDDDCNGTVDDGWDKDGDPANCGGCGIQCTALLPNAVVSCQQGQCQLDACLTGFFDIDPATPGCEYACTPAQGGNKVCGSPADNDCNGVPDQQEFDTSTDPDHCGQCNYRCEVHKPYGTEVLPGAQACQGGVCGYGCLPGFHDTVPGVPGCECEESNGAVEQCDGVDNDCDGTVDNGFDLLTDADHCGSCGFRCADLPVPANAQLAGCVNGQCRFQCVGDHHDINGDLNGGAAPPTNDGCEYACTPAGAETCNGADDDCDGDTDEDGGGQPLTRSCYTGTPAGSQSNPPCRAGQQTCTGGGWGSCLGEITPVPEVCGDGVDNDCNGTPDDGFDFQNDVENCGGCDQSCFLLRPPNTLPATPGCVNGECRYVCIAGFADHDNDRNDPPGTSPNGCEYTCPRFPTVAEECNDLDDDCDGGVDEDLPATQDICPRSDDAGTPCFGALATCRDPDGAGGLPKGWYCVYAPEVDVDPTEPNLLAEEGRCDGVDNDCDGQTDETFPTVGQECDNGLLGACRDVGERVCDPGDPYTTTCDLSVLPDADPAAPSAEVCNGVDDNCDGIRDNPDPADPDRVVDDMVHITHSGLDFWIYTYEASRPDADDLDPGVSDARACSRDGALPWTNVTWDDAEAACLAVGKRLCTAAEWVAACQGATGTVYPYGDLYEGAWCNGEDHDGVPGGADDDVLLPTGDLGMCLSADGAYDLSGNVREWTDDLRGTTSGGDPIYVVRGGEYHTPSPGLTCSFDLSQAVYDVVLPTIGFRCCSDTAP